MDEVWNLLFYFLGFGLELVGIGWILSNSNALSNWMFKHWMCSLPEGFDEMKSKFENKNKINTILGFSLIGIGFLLQGIVTVNSIIHS